MWGVVDIGRRIDFFVWKFCENGELALEKAEPHSYQIDNLMEIVSYPAKVGHKYKIL